MTILFVGVGLVAALAITRLAYVQIVHGKEYKEDADRQYVTPKGSTIERGSIYFTDKNGTLISAAAQVEGYKLTITPKELEDSDRVFASLLAILPALDKESFLESAAKTKDPYEEIATRLTKEEADAISALSIPGVKLYKDKWRFYPGDSLAAHTIGFVAYKGDDLSGRYGLERSYDSVLSRSGEGNYVNFFAEVFSNLGDAFFENTKGKGNVVTTIEPTVEQELEKTLREVQEKWGAEFAGGIIMDPHTGEIYAMGKSPSFDLNNSSKVENPRTYSNPFVENVFEFGSVIKPLVMAAAIDSGAVTPETTYFDKGFVEVKNRTFNNFDRKGRGTASMQDVLNQSLNTGMVFVQQKMGKEMFKKYIYSYGIGERTGIDLPNETLGLVGNLKTGGDVEYATAAFGQGIALTPVAAVHAFSALANNGVMVTPHLVKEIDHDVGGKEIVELTPGTRVISEASAATITKMLTTVVDKGMGEGSHKMEHYTIAAKTGTAQIAKEAGGGYYEDKYLHSFFGYFPAKNPKFLVLLFLRDPKGVDFASQTLIDPFFSLAKFLLHYYSVPPDR